MEPRRLAILGAGSLRCGPPTLAALANYFGEHDLEVRLWDADEERLDLADRLARTMFVVEEAKHLLVAASDVREALDQADAAILMVEHYCARRFLDPTPPVRLPYPSRLDPSPIAEASECGPIVGPGVPLPPPPIEDQDPDSVPRAVAKILGEFSGPILSFLSQSVWTGDRVLTIQGWPPEVDAATQRSLPHLFLRWLRGEEYVGSYIRLHAKSPIRAWLDQTI